MFDFLFGPKKEAPPVPPPQIEVNESKNNEKSISKKEQTKSDSQQQFGKNNPQTVQQVQMINDNQNLIFGLSPRSAKKIGILFSLKKDQNTESSKGLRKDELDDDEPAKTDAKKNDLGNQKKQTLKNPQSHTSPNPNLPNQVHPKPNGQSPNVPNQNHPLPTTVLTDPNPITPSPINGSNKNEVNEMNPNQPQNSPGGNQNEGNQANPVPRNTISPTSDILELNNRLKNYKDNLYGPGSKQNKIKKLDLCFEVTSSQNYKRNLETLQKLKNLHDQRSKKQKDIQTRKKSNAQKKKKWEEYLKQKKDYDNKMKQINKEKQEKGQLEVNPEQGYVSYTGQGGYQVNVGTDGVGVNKSGVSVGMENGKITVQTPLSPQQPIGEMPGICSDCDWQQCCMNCGNCAQAICDGCQGIGEIMECCSDCDCAICHIFDACGIDWLPWLVVGIAFIACPLVYFGCVANKYCNSKETNRNLASVTEQMLEIYNSYQGFAP